MQKHLNQAQHNEKFLQVLDDNKIGFFDWRITIVFYIALHYLRAYQKIKKVSIGDSHKEFFEAINPQQKNLLSLSDECYSHYRNIFNICHNARYKGFLSDNNMGLMKINYNDAQNSLKEIKKYLKSQGMKI